MSRTLATAANLAVPASLAAPVGGWNARDALGSMKPLDAVYLKNWFPTPTDVGLRLGYSNFATGMSGQVESLMAYAGGATDKLFAAVGTSIYDVSSGGAVGAAAVTSLTNARFQYVNVATAGGNFLLAVNGADKMRYYTGSGWTADGGGTYTVTGVNTNTIIGITLFKNRVWMVQKDTLNAWYLGTNSIQGTATAFPLQGIARLGGYIMAVGTWTMDGGYGMDDMLVFITNKGEVIVYNGLDPAEASSWQLTGVWNIGSPVGRRCFLKMGGDLLVICQDGLLPLSRALQSDRVDTSAALTDKILSAISQATTTYGANYGWQLCTFPKQNMLLLNVPVATGSQEQYVMNTITKAWCNFTGWAANCWELWGDQVYFGGNGVVCKAWDTYADGSANIVGDGKQAFNYFGTPGMLKHFTMMRPIISTNGSPSIGAGINVDFEDTNVTSTVSFASTSYGVWDTSKWDQGLWGGGNTIQKQWQGVTGIGYCAAPRVQVASQGIDVRWIATDLVMRRGAIL